MQRLGRSVPSAGNPPVVVIDDSEEEDDDDDDDDNDIEVLREVIFIGEDDDGEDKETEDVGKRAVGGDYWDPNFGFLVGTYACMVQGDVHPRDLAVFVRRTASWRIGYKRHNFDMDGNDVKVVKTKGHIVPTILPWEKIVKDPQWAEYSKAEMRVIAKAIFDSE